MWKIGTVKNRPSVRMEHQKTEECLNPWVQPLLSHIHIWLDHVPITKIHLSPAAKTRRMFCQFCLQVPLYICLRHLPIFFNDLFCKIERVISFFWSRCNLQYCIVKQLITISISKRQFWVIIFGYLWQLAKDPCRRNVQKCSSPHCCKRKMYFAITTWSSCTVLFQSIRHYTDCDMLDQLDT